MWSGHICHTHSLLVMCDIVFTVLLQKFYCLNHSGYCRNCQKRYLLRAIIGCKLRYTKHVSVGQYSIRS